MRAQTLIAELYGGGSPERHLGRGTCYIEFGRGRIGSVDIDFLSGPEKTGTFNAPSAEQMALKERFGSVALVQQLTGACAARELERDQLPSENGDGGKVLAISVALIRKLHEERFGPKTD